MARPTSAPTSLGFAPPIQVRSKARQVFPNLEGGEGTLLRSGQFVKHYDGFADSITVNFITTATGSVQFNLGVADPGAPIDWSSVESQMQPPGVSNAAWNAVFANFTAQVGNTMGGLQTALDIDANYLAQLGIDTSDVTRLLAFQLDQAGDFGAIAQRDAPGIFGLGIPNPTRTAVTDAQGNVGIVSGSAVRPFTLQPDGSYRGAPGDFATLTLTAVQRRERHGGSVLEQPAGLCSGRSDHRARGASQRGQERRGSAAGLDGNDQGIAGSNGVFTILRRARGITR